MAAPSAFDPLTGCRHFRDRAFKILAELVCRAASEWNVARPATIDAAAKVKLRTYLKTLVFH
jgi:hypothetical protein